MPMKVIELVIVVLSPGLGRNIAAVNDTMIADGSKCLISKLVFGFFLLAIVEL